MCEWCDLYYFEIIVETLAKKVLAQNDIYRVDETGPYLLQIGADIMPQPVKVFQYPGQLLDKKTIKKYLPS